MILYLGVYRPFKYTVSNFVAIILESFLLVVYLECVGLSDKYSSKASLCKAYHHVNYLFYSLDFDINRFWLCLGG